MLLALAFVAYAMPPIEGETLENGLRTGWWPVWSESGVLLGETRYEEGVAVEGLAAPDLRPRCLAEPPPDGLYGLPDAADEMVARPVAVVEGCVGATSGDAWNHGVTVAGRNRFLVVDSEGERCLHSGKTVDYEATAEGLTATLRTWTRCAGGSERASDPVALVRIEAIAVEGAFEHSQEAVRAAALEALAARQPEEESCEPLGRAIRGGVSPEATLRSTQVATAPCLAESLRVALLDHRYEPAAAGLARASDAKGPLGRDLLRAIDLGFGHATTTPLAQRLFDLGPIDPSVRAALAEAVVDPDGTEATRRAAAVTIDQVLREADDGRALIGAADKKGSCEGWGLLMGTSAVKASGYFPPRSVAKRCDLGEPRPFY